MMKLLALLSVAALGLSLAACGGSDGGGIAIATVPLPSPSPTPTPGFTPTVVPSTLLSGSTASVYPKSATITENILADSARVTVGRDDAGNYLITLPVPTGQVDGWSDGLLRKFQFVKADAETTSDGVIHYRVGKSGSIFPNETSFLTIIPANSSRNSLQHVNFAFLGVCLAGTCADGQFPGGEMFPLGNLLVFGTSTPGSDVPVSGLATYSGSFETSGGPIRGSCGDEFCNPNYTAGHLIGNLSLGIDFGRGAVTGQFSSVTDTTGYFNNSDLDPLRHIPDFALSGQIGSGGSLAGSVTATPGTSFSDGRWTASFFGPGAAEIGGTMILNSSLSDFSGWFGAKKD
jgi:hypothetical protein